jgi:AcrR family transcriptional regulator
VTTQQRGRPPAASRTMVQEAAFELFLEQGYAGTRVEDIARRCGVSRATFFNYFTGKGDVFWLDLDEGLAALAERLETAQDGEPLETARQALLGAAEVFGADRVPWALTHHDIIGATVELQSAALGRLGEAAGRLADHLARRGTPQSGAAAYALLAATVAAARDWAAAGPTRGPLRPWADAATAPVAAGYAAAR